MRAAQANDTRISRLIIQHQTRHGHFEAHRIRFDLDGIPKCKTDNAIMTDTHYLTCSRGQVYPDTTNSIDEFSAKRLKKFRKQARDKGISLLEAIHRRHMTKGTSRFIETMRKKRYWHSVGWVEEEEFQTLEPATPDAEDPR